MKYTKYIFKEKILKHDDEVLHKEIKTLRNELQGL